MRIVLLASILLLPQISRAQLFGGNSFAAGSYVLADARNVRQPAQLKLQSGSKLVVKTADGQTLKFKPTQVQSFRIGSQKYIVARNFHVIGGLGGADVDDAFVEQLDSGQVVLARYDYSVGSGMSMSGGGMMTGGGSSELSALLLRGRYSSSFTAAQGGVYSSGGKRFREAVRPFLAARPDLVKLLDEKRITSDNLREAIHALNNNLPFAPPSALNLD